MYGEVLKFGAMIVDSLRTYKHPVFVYIPPGESRRIIILESVSESFFIRPPTLTKLCTLLQ